MKKDLIIKEKNDKLDSVYADLEDETVDVMKNAVATMYLATQNAKFVMGEQLSKVQEELVGHNQHDGYFTRWYIALGLKKDYVYACMRYYKLLVANPDDQILEALSFSKVSELGRLNDKTELQEKLIKKAPLKEMKVKQVEELVKKVDEKEEVTDELIAEICSETTKQNTNLDKFVKATTSLIKDLKEQSEKFSKKSFGEVLNLVKKVEALCKIEE